MSQKNCIYTIILRHDAQRLHIWGRWGGGGGGGGGGWGLEYEE